jgi:hypothetical protein
MTAGQIQRAPASTAGRAPAMRRMQAYFEYVGGTGMTVLGGVTGRRYRFERPGARVAVDPADKLSLAKVPHLKPVSGP